ncbi:hypothetical protein Pmani_006019 [Petrolisthes manimaculis]|uniref:Ionotropic glutamate receptor L-glutamate and glycine-binding domain-containing protein n=1 Tax=Petrolisthes manimaculis TaxID=1843537 RepID=A0AAE1QAK4_9EUCA|nr:hypothetical protein Pmani_006019 [Petrolisthes manimaculis]
MEWWCVFLGLLTTLLITSTSSTAAYIPLLANVTDVEGSHNIEGEEALVLLNFLAGHYTPKCLKIILHTGRNYSSEAVPPSRPASLRDDDSDAFMNVRDMTQNNNMNAIHVSDSNTEETHINLNAGDINKCKHILRYINENTERLTSFSCVTYILTQPPDPRLLPSLTDSTSHKRLTRYFLVHTRNMMEAETLLLDQRLRDEENVATLTRHQQAQKKGRSSWWSWWWWQISFRQLLHPSGSPQVVRLSKWSGSRADLLVSSNTIINNNNIFPEQMNNFYGTRLKGVSLDFEPFISYEDNDLRLIRSRPCLDVFILNAIADSLNFTYDLFKSEDGQWGFQKADGHWAGVVGDVEMRRANFSLCLSKILARVRSVDFTRMYYRDPMTFLAAKSRPSPPWRKLLTPFTMGVWVATVGCVCVSAMFYYIICTAQTNLGSSLPSSSPAFMHVLGSFLSQSLRHIPWLSAGKVFLGFWLLHGLLVTTYYKTSLTGTLAVPFASPTLDTLQQLLNSDINPVMKEAKGSDYQLFSTSSVSLYQRVFQSLTFLLEKDILTRVVEGQDAFIFFKSSLDFRVATQYTTAYGETNLHVASDEFFPGGYAWAFPKGSPYRKPFDKVMWWCVQAGLIDKWLKDLNLFYLKERLEKRSPEERRRDEEEAETSKEDGMIVLNLNHLQGPFFILLLGCAGGGLVFVLQWVAFTLQPSLT